jgi:hypothetical protein
VEIELRSRIFERFRGAVKSSQPERSERQPLKKLNTYLEGRGILTLGDMSAILEDCKRPQGKTLIEFEGWLRNGKFDLNKITLLLPEINDLRKRATHPLLKPKSSQGNTLPLCRSGVGRFLKHSPNHPQTEHQFPHCLANIN